MTIKATTVVRFSVAFYLKQQTTLSCQKTYFKRKIINAIGVCPPRQANSFVATMSRSSWGGFLYRIKVDFCNHIGV